MIFLNLFVCPVESKRNIFCWSQGRPSRKQNIFTQLKTISSELNINIFDKMKKGSKFVSLRACLVSYQTTKRDVNNHHKFITSQLERRVQTEPQFTKFRQRLNSYLQQTKLTIKKGKKFAGFKLAMLIHYLFLSYTPLVRNKEKNQNNVKIFYFLNQLITTLHEKLGQNLPNPVEKDKVFLCENIIMPYVFYLQKKFQYIEIKLMQMQENGYVSEPIKQNQPDYSQNRLALLKQQCYKYLNLLNKGLLLSNKLLTLLTYYLEEHQYLQNFNILLATDFAPIYTNMGERFNQIKQIQKHLQIQSEQFRELEKEIEKAHEGMFIIYLNRYMNHMRFLTPKFVDCNSSKTNLEIFFDKKNNPENPEKKRISKIRKYLSMNNPIEKETDLEAENDDGANSQYLTNNLTSSQTLSLSGLLEEEDPFDQLRGSFKKKIMKNQKQSSEQSSGKKQIEILSQQTKARLKKYPSMGNSIDFEPIIVQDDGDQQDFMEFDSKLSASQKLPMTREFQFFQLRSSFKKKVTDKQSSEGLSNSRKSELGRNQE